jgi:hypothetical protein
MTIIENYLSQLALDTIALQHPLLEKFAFVLLLELV